MAAKKKQKRKASTPKRASRSKVGKKSSKRAKVRTSAKKTVKKTIKKKKSPVKGARPTKPVATSRASQQKRTPTNPTPREPRSSTRERAGRGFGDEDSQGLSKTAGADSESVSELLEEGNTFEASAVRGVEEADNADGREVHTRELPEDDVPEEYLDKD